jgi:hypothetical protein
MGVFRGREHGWAYQRVKCWEIIPDKITASGWTWGYRTFATESESHYIVEAHRGDGRGCIPESDEVLTAFLELEAILL